MCETVEEELDLLRRMIPMLIRVTFERENSKAAKKRWLKMHYSYRGATGCPRWISAKAADALLREIAPAAKKSRAASNLLWFQAMTDSLAERKP